VSLKSVAKGATKLPRILPSCGCGKEAVAGAEIVTYTALAAGIWPKCAAPAPASVVVPCPLLCDSRNIFLSFLPWLVGEIGYG